MTDTSAFGGESLLGLFKMEAESHCAVLSDGLLALERSPGDASPVEGMMRAAHSIKGAAKIVGLDVIVPLAHAMEECFLAAKAGREPLTSSRVDQLLKCVDVIGEVRAMAEADVPAWTKRRAEHVAAMVAMLKAPPPPASERKAETSATPIAPPADAPVSESSKEPDAAPVKPATPEAGGSAAASASMRIAASALNRMLFLAGESTVEATRLQGLRSLAVGLKSRGRGLEAAVHALGDALAGHPAAGGDVGEAYAALVAATAAVETARGDQQARLDDAFRRVEEVSGALYTEVVRSRMRPFSEGIGGFPRMVRDLARELGKEVVLKIDGESVQVDRDILQKLESPLTHLIRNSLDHGVESPEERRATGKLPGATVQLSARHQAGALVVEVCDDGRGVDPERVRRKVVEKRLVEPTTAEKLTTEELMEMLFLPGFSTKEGVTEISGRGVGLNVVQSMVQQVGGMVTLESEPGKGARFVLRLPVTRSVVRAAVVRIGRDFYGVPLAKLERIVLVPESEARPVQGRAQINVDGASIGLVWASELLGLGDSKTASPMLVAMIVGQGADRYGVVVDEAYGEEDLVVRPLDARLGQVPHVASAAIRSDGVPMLVLDVDDLWRSVKQALEGGRQLGLAARHAGSAARAGRRVLVVDDSITVREVERQLLIRHGYHVDVAVDGKDGFNMLRAGRYDLLVTDVDMPRMTGIELTRAVRREPKLSELPIIIVSYKDREEDRLAGMEAGASAYMTKGSFQDESLVRLIRDLIGSAGLMRIGIVNDLRLAVESLRRAVAAVPDASVAWVAEDGAQAVACCARDVPDIVLMDMIMPVMDGVEATRRIMAATPCPILVVTATVEGNASKVFEALGAGALDAVATPGLSADGGVVNAEPLRRKILSIAKLTGRREGSVAPAPSASTGSDDATGLVPCVAIGSSTGGPQALAVMLRGLPRPVPWPVVIVQHIDTTFASGLSEWLTRETGHQVAIIRGGEAPSPGRVHIAATVDHLIADRAGRLRYTPEPREVVYRPSVDAFFNSLSATNASPGVAVILTGMGRDGAAGMAALKARGWVTIAQDKATSVVWGMPGAAAESGAAQRVLPIEAIASAITAGMGMPITRSREPA